MWHGHVTWSWAALRETQPRCVSTECGLGFTLAIWAFRSRFSTSRLRFSPRAVDKEASLELSRASRSLSLCSAPVRSDSFLPFLQRTAENGNEKKWLEKLCGWPFRGKTFFLLHFYLLWTNVEWTFYFITSLQNIVSLLTFEFLLTNILSDFTVFPNTWWVFFLFSSDGCVHLKPLDMN